MYMQVPADELTLRQAKKIKTIDDVLKLYRDKKISSYVYSIKPLVVSKAYVTYMMEGGSLKII